MRTTPALLLLIPQARVPDVPARASIRRTRTARQPQPKGRPQTTEAVPAAATSNRGLGWVTNLAHGAVGIDRREAERSKERSKGGGGQRSTRYRARQDEA